jgi:hypothetical protein
MRPISGFRLKVLAFLVVIVFFIGATVMLWPGSRFWFPIAACGQLLSAVAVFFLTLNFIIENKRENAKDIESAIQSSDKLQLLMEKWEEALAAAGGGKGTVDFASPEGLALARLGRRIQDEIVRYSIMIESGAVNLELVETYSYLNRDFVNLFIRFDVGHEGFGVRLAPDWEIARPIVAKIVESRQHRHGKGR